MRSRDRTFKVGKICRFVHKCLSDCRVNFFLLFVASFSVRIRATKIVCALRWVDLILDLLTAGMNWHPLDFCLLNYLLV